MSVITCDHGDWPALRATPPCPSLGLKDLRNASQGKSRSVERSRPRPRSLLFCDSGDSLPHPVIFPLLLQTKGLVENRPCTAQGPCLDGAWTELGRSLGGAWAVQAQAQAERLQVWPKTKDNSDFGGIRIFQRACYRLTPRG